MTSLVWLKCRCLMDVVRISWPLMLKVTSSLWRSNAVRRTFWAMLNGWTRSEEHTSELQSLMRISYAVFCLTKKINFNHTLKARIPDRSDKQLDLVCLGVMYDDDNGR